MKQNFKKALILTFIPAFLNLAVTFYIQATMGVSQFRGYLTGTLLCILFSFLWLWQVNRSADTNALVLIKINLLGFLSKLLVLCAFLIGGYYIFNFDRMYLGISFFAGTICGIFIEVWYFMSSIKENKPEKM